VGKAEAPQTTPAIVAIPLVISKYNFYAAMLVNASAKQTYATLTNYRLYSELVPFVDSVHYSAATHVLQLEGGIWKFHLSSELRFREHPDRWIDFEVIAGHFKGLVGHIYFEPQSEKGTLVYLTGEISGTVWPPQIVIERGAEIVFGFAAQRMRSYIEKQSKQGASNGETQKGQIPQPRSHL
jgi:ribosome-associated toxin RatA of RatAB toxin-antitoxin module